MKRFVLTAMLLLCVSISSAAVVTGVVIDANDSKPIGQVKVSIDSVHFTYSDMFGNFALTVDDAVMAQTPPVFMLFENSAYVPLARSIINFNNNPSAKMHRTPDANTLAAFSKLHGDTIITPMGPRHKSKVHKVGRGNRVDFSGERILEKDAVGNIINDFGLNSNSNKIITPAQDANWLTYTGWTTPSAQYTSAFYANWVVPQNPSYIDPNNPQLIYLFNGMEDAAYIYILQPVLQWGFNGGPDGFGGNYWLVACWYAYSGPAPDQTQISYYQFEVSPGEILRGNMTGSPSAGGGGFYDYDCTFAGIPWMDLGITGVKLTWNNIALEAYPYHMPPAPDVNTLCNEFPGTDATLFSGIEIMTGSNNAHPSFTWTAYNVNPGCGRKTTVIKNANPGGLVALSYSYDHFILADPKNNNCTSYNWYKGSVNNTTLSYSQTTEGMNPSSRIRTAMSHNTGTVCAMTTGSQRTMQTGRIDNNGDITWVAQFSTPLNGADEVCLSDNNDVIVFYVSSQNILYYSTGNISSDLSSVTWNQTNVQFKQYNGSALNVQSGGNFFAASLGSVNDDRVAMFWKTTNNILYYYNAFYSSSQTTVTSDNNSYSTIPHGTLLSIDIAYDRNGWQLLVQNEQAGSSYNTWLVSRQDRGGSGNYLQLPNRICGRAGMYLGKGMLWTKGNDLTGYLSLINPSGGTNHQPTKLSETSFGSCKRVDNNATHCDIAF